MTDAHCHVSGGDPAVRELLIGRDFVGVHPWDVEKWKSGKVEKWVDDLREQLAANPRLGVGEIGLDRLKEKTISSEMRELFTAQLAFAFEFRRPVVLHGAKCWGEVVKQVTRNREQGTSEECLTSCSSVLPESDASATTRVPCSLFHVTSSPLLFHGFSRSDGLIPDIVRLNGYISVGPAVLNDHAVNYRALVKKIPLDRLLVETDRDCPPEELLNPLTKQPLVIRDVLEKTAEIRGLSPSDLEAVTDENASRFLTGSMSPVTME